MPKRLNISSNERVDLVDFDRASADYTKESDNFDRQKLTQARRSLVASGFRIEIADQATSPGQFTIYNGVALDRSGNILNNEQQVNDARSLTLSGTSTKFYIEVEFVEAESDVDSRAFWDPTFTGNTPPGKEFTLNVATRLSPDWQVVSPVSTTQFDVDANVNSVKVPIAILYTDGTNLISGYSAVNAASVLEEDSGAAPTKIRVLDSSLFPSSGTATLGLGTGNSESVTFTANDLENGIITLAPAASNAHSAGAILKDITSTAAFLPEDTAAVPATPGATSSADQRRGLFTGDETRGSALSASDQDATARSDLAVKSLKDHVDFLSAQIREMKFGSLRPGAASPLPPSSFTATRYYDQAGSITGAKSVILTIGDTIKSFGDLNSSSDDLGTIIDQAHNFLDATEGGEIIVRAGNYVWDALVEVDRPLKITFEEGVVFDAGTYSASPLSLKTSELVEIVNMPPVPSTELPFPIIPVDSSFQPWNPNFRAVDSYVNIDWTPTGEQGDNRIVLHNCTMISTAGNPAIRGTSGTGSKFELLEFKDCSISYVDAADSTVGLLDGLNVDNCLFENCTFDLTGSTGSAAAFLANTNGGNFVADRCKFLSNSSGLAKSPIKFGTFADKSFTFKDCVFDFYFDPGTVSSAERSVIYCQGKDVTVEGCDFSAIESNIIPSTTTGATGVVVYLRGTGTHYIKNNFFGHRSTTSSPINQYVQQVYAFGGTVHIVDNEFNHFYKAIEFDQSTNGTVRGNSFYQFFTGDPLRSSTCVHWDSDGQLVVSENTYTQRSGGSDGTDEFMFCNILNTTLAPVISNNTLEMNSDAGVVRGVQLTTSGAIDKVPRAVITGNSAKLTATSATSLQFVQVVSPGSETNIDLVVSDNRIRISHTGTGEVWAINLDSTMSTTDENIYGVIIKGNTMYVAGNITGTVWGIQVQANNVLVSANSIYCSGRVSGTAAGSCVATDGHRITITDNIMSNEDDKHSSVVVCAAASVSSNQTPGNITISGNTVYQDAAAVAVLVSNGGFDFINNIVISGNNITGNQSTATASTRCVEVTSTGVMAGILVSNNVCREQGTVSTTNQTRMIYVAGNAANVLRGLSITGNVIGSDIGATVRSTTSHAIGVNYCYGVVISNNAIQEWAGTGTGRTLIDVDNCFDLVVCSNSLNPGNASGAMASIDIHGTNGATISGNVARISLIDIAAASNVAIDGTNRIT